MNKYLIPTSVAAFLVVIVLIVVLAVNKSNNSSTNLASANNTTTSSLTNSTPGNYKDGEYTGDTFSNRYGNVQVKVTVSGSQISDVTFLKYPNEERESQEVSDYAMPNLIRETLSSQKANVDIVTGATQTSESFNQSLSSALNKAL
jgi:uncharacterized protein with FMN-binding domain